jgi:hypothetical protein
MPRLFTNSFTCLLLLIKDCRLWQTTSGCVPFAHGAVQKLLKDH